MTTRTVYPDKSFPQLGPELDLDWRIWLAQHGLPNPEDLPLRNNPIICDDTARTVTVERYVRTPKGHCQLDPSRPNELLTEPVTVQLEAPALPIPNGYEVVVA